VASGEPTLNLNLNSEQVHTYLLDFKALKIKTQGIAISNGEREHMRSGNSPISICDYTH
jgi:hypothetical protein